MNFTSTDGILSVGIATSYKIYLNFQLRENKLSCVDEECEYMVNVSSADCLPLNDVTAMISAANAIGESPSIDLPTIGIPLLLCNNYYMYATCMDV